LLVGVGAGRISRYKSTNARTRKRRKIADRVVVNLSVLVCTPDGRVRPDLAMVQCDLSVEATLAVLAAGHAAGGAGPAGRVGLLPALLAILAPTVNCRGRAHRGGRIASGRAAGSAWRASRRRPRDLGAAVGHRRRQLPHASGLTAGPGPGARPGLGGYRDVRRSESVYCGSFSGERDRAGHRSAAAARGSWWLVTVRAHR
jgi:hypothetical protein